MNFFSMLYRVFYDKKLATEFIKNGKGRGGKVLFVLAVFVAFSVAVRAFLTVDTLKDLPVSEMTKNMPEIEFENNKIVSPENYYASFSDRENKVVFAFDTTENPLSFSDKTGIFMRKDALIVQNGNETRILPYQKLLNGENLTITRDVMTELFQKIINSLRMTLPPVLFMLILPVLFLWYIILSYFYGVMSYLMTFALHREPAYDERIRLAVLSMMPWTVLNALATLLGVNIRFGVASGLLLTLIYMFCFLKEERETKTV